MSNFECVEVCWDAFVRCQSKVNYCSRLVKFAGDKWICKSCGCRKRKKMTNLTDVSDVEMTRYMDRELHHITLHYRAGISNATYTLSDQWCINVIHVIRNTAHRPSMQAIYTASRVRPIRKISCAAAQIAATQIAATLTILFPRWRHMSLTYVVLIWGQQRMSL